MAKELDPVIEPSTARLVQSLSMPPYARNWRTTLPKAAVQAELLVPPRTDARLQMQDSCLAYANQLCSACERWHNAVAGVRSSC
eukprot:1637242-Amphidinium_carterae.2